MMDLVVSEQLLLHRGLVNYKYKYDTWAIAYLHTLVPGHNSDWYSIQMQQRRHFYYTERESPRHQYSTYSQRQWDHCLDHKY